MGRKTLTIDKNTAIHCPTQELADKLSQYVSGIDPILWKYYKGNTCLYVKGTYGALIAAKTRGYTILTAEEVIARFEYQDLYSRLVKPKVAIHCETEEEAEQLLSWADDQGLKWSNRKSYLGNTAYSSYKNSTCYSLYAGGYSSISFYESEDYDIIKFSSIPEFQTNPITTYNIDKSKLKPNTVIPCDTFEKALAITSIVGDPIVLYQFSLYSNTTSIRILDNGWTYENTPYYERDRKFTIISFEEVLMKSEDTALTEFQIGDLIYWTEEAEKHISYTKAGELAGKVTQIKIRKSSDSLIEYEDTKKQLKYIDSNCVTKIPLALTKYAGSKVAQQKPIKSIKKEESFMSKLKATALTTVEQNKEAAIIAAKMEAGRIITKQVIKQAAKHVPFWAKGYLDTPLAPVILANGVAMLGNHTGNPKVQKVAEFMLLAAADTTVQSFNLDKIIDDVLSGVKLPAGILNDEE